MAKNQIYKFKDVDQATIFLNGGIIGATSMRSQSTNARTNLIPAIYGLVGKELKFLQPSVVTITFVAGSAPDDPQSLTFQDIKAQIEAGFGGPPTTSSALIVRSFDAFISMIETTPTNGVSLGLPAGGSALDARPLLGFSEGQNSTGVLYKPAAVSNTPPCWTWADTNNENMHVIYVWQ
jgi:hypothetical protein